MGDKEGIERGKGEMEAMMNGKGNEDIKNIKWR